MALLDETAPDTNYTFMDEASAHFLRAIKQHYTRDAAVDVMDALTPILGKAWKGRVIFNIMANHYQEVREIIIFRDYQVSYQKIAAIKEVRSMSGMGLTEAKDFVEAADNVPKTFSMKLRPADIDPAVWDRGIIASTVALKNFGFKVETR